MSFWFFFRLPIKRHYNTPVTGRVHGQAPAAAIGDIAIDHTRIHTPRLIFIFIFIFTRGKCI